MLLGMAGYVDRLIMGPSHLYDGPTCKEIYDTKIPYDPEGIFALIQDDFILLVIE